jgi:hypothetical protein
MLSRSRAFHSAVLFTLGLAACADSPTGPKEPLPVTRIEQGAFSSATTSQRVVIRSQQQLVAAWAVIHPAGPLALPPPLPVIDFATEMAVVVFAGEKPSGGYCIVVDGAAGDSRTIELTVRSVGPTPANGVLPVVTHPFDLVRVPRRDEVRFNEISEIGNCGPIF